VVKHNSVFVCQKSWWLLFLKLQVQMLRRPQHPVRNQVWQANIKFRHDHQSQATFMWFRVAKFIIHFAVVSRKSEVWSELLVMQMTKWVNARCGLNAWVTSVSICDMLVDRTKFQITASLHYVKECKSVATTAFRTLQHYDFCTINAYSKQQCLRHSCVCSFQLQFRLQLHKAQQARYQPPPVSRYNCIISINLFIRALTSMIHVPETNLCTICGSISVRHIDS